MSSWPWTDARPEQEWTLLLALSAFLPHALALANVRGWIGHNEGVLNELSSLYFLACPVTIVLAVWALARSRRTFRAFRIAGTRERAFAIMAAVLSIPTVLVAALLFLAMTIYVISGGG